MKMARATLPRTIILILASSLLTSAALSDERDIADYGASTNGFFPELGILKNQNDCPDGTAFFKNVVPGLTNGSGPGSTVPPIDFIIDGKTVSMSISWSAENSFAFNLTGGIAHIVGVTSDTNNLLYNYVSFRSAGSVVAGTVIGPVFADGNLNDIDAAADVNHLDLCLSPVDSTPPTIEFISPLPGDTVSGTVTVEVSVTDESSVGSVTASVYPVGDTWTATPIVLTSQDGVVYTGYWTTVDPLADPPVDFPAGSYTIAVTATDQAVPRTNTATVDISIELAKSLADCFGTLGDEDFTGTPEPGTNYTGCQPTPLVNIQANPDTSVCNVDDPPAICAISGRLLKPNSAKIASLGCDACREGYCGVYGLPDPRMVCSTATFDQDGNCTGEWTPNPDVPLQRLLIEDVADDTEGAALGKYVYGYKGCFAAARHVRFGELSELYLEWPEEGLVFIKKHTPAAVLPLSVVADCNVGLPEAAQAGYQPIGKTKSVDTLDDGVTPAITLVATQKCNAPRTLTRDNGIDVSNIIETDGSDDPLAFKYQMAEKQFEATFVALACAENEFQRGRVKFSDVTSPVNQAKAQFDNGTIAALERARDDLDDAALAIRSGDWNVTAENCAGDALARIENLEWRMTDILAALGVPAP